MSEKNEQFTSLLQFYKSQLGLTVSCSRCSELCEQSCQGSTREVPAALSLPWPSLTGQAGNGAAPVLGRLVWDWSSKLSAQVQAKTKAVQLCMVWHHCS